MESKYIAEKISKIDKNILEIQGMKVDNLIKQSLVHQEKSKKSKLVHKLKHLKRIDKTTKTSACILEVSFFVLFTHKNFCRSVDTCYLS